MLASKACKVKYPFARLLALFFRHRPTFVRLFAKENRLVGPPMSLLLSEPAALVHNSFIRHLPSPHFSPRRGIVTSDNEVGRLT
jgi:hypothetical protein